MINSTSNKQVKRVINLRDKAKARREEGLYVAEGLRMCREYKPDDVEILYITENFGKQEENKKWLRGFKFEFVTDEVMILENIQDPGNLGTIIRAGEGAGITGVVMSSDTADIYNPKVIRSTMGSVLRVPFVYASDLKEACEQMKKAGISLYAAHLKGMHNYDQEDYTKDTGFLIGNEAKGLTDEMAAVADTYIKIPMAGQVESLNAAVASSVLMFEAARQRRNS